ncbi:hypothetical protein AB2N08_20150 [Massilia aurea]|uniref:hypothetical protein n=1 Tax=Massilia aurea TaxID=373040 RepID=UPI003463841B
MKSTPQQTLRIVPPAAGPVSRAHKQFNTLIKKLEAARALLVQWNDTLPVLVAKINHEYVPLAEAYEERLKQLVVLLDEVHGEKQLGKRERQKLSRFISDTAFQLMSGGDDDALKSVYNRHSGADFDADEARSKDEIRQMMESMLGAEFKGDIDVRSPEAMLMAFQAQLEEQDAASEPDQHQHRGAPASKRPADLARERRQAAEAERMQQSLRGIFRKLASQLHPDRETDAVERQRKTALMQRVNVAYAANDMLGLLELQLEVEQIDQASLATLSDERVKQYNKVLKEQLSELESEVAGFVEVAAMEIDAGMFDVVTPVSVLRTVDADIAEMHVKLMVIDDDLQVQRDVSILKVWLKSMPN